MKKIYILLLVSLLCTSVGAQNPTTYFMEGSTLRSQWNPAFAPQRGYINIPILGGIQTNVSGDIALNNILLKQDNQLATIFDSDIAASVVLAGLNDMNHIGFGAHINIIGFGAFTKNNRNFWSAEINLRSDGDIRIPYEFFDFLKSGTSGNFANLGGTANSFIETCFSYSFPITDRLYLGARGKFLVGMSKTGFNFSNFEAQLGEDKWYASITGAMETTGIIPNTKLTDEGDTVYDLDDFGGNVKMPAGYGFGIDVGATYDLLPELQLSLSANDIGAIFWSKKCSGRGYMDAQIEFTGIEIDEQGNAVQPKFDLEQFNFDVEENKTLSNMLYTSINAGADYNFLDRRIGLGLFYSVRFREFKPQHILTTSANFRPLKWLHLSGSYSYLGDDQHNTGMALNICPSFINFFIGTDILFCKKTPQWIPIQQSNINLTFGLGVPIGRKSERRNYF